MVKGPYPYKHIFSISFWAICFYLNALFFYILHESLRLKVVGEKSWCHAILSTNQHSASFESESVDGWWLFADVKQTDPTTPPCNELAEIFEYTPNK